MHRHTIVLAAIGLFSTTATCDSRKESATWYHESDVAMLSTTGRPQLVEFFHPD